MVDFMAEDGIVGQYAGSQAREVLMTMEEWAAAQGEEPLPPDPPPRRLKINPHAEEIVADDSEDDEPTHDGEAPSIVDEIDEDEEEDGEEHTEPEDEDEEEDEEYEYVYEDDEEHEEDEEEDETDE
jgi:S-DNA-T family DNA segregation ATPase FtsK/SpoIIIE